MCRLEKGSQIRSTKDQTIYVGISTPTGRSGSMNDDNDGVKVAGAEAAEIEKKGKNHSWGESAE